MDARRRLLIAGAATLALPALADSRRLIAPMTDGPFYPPAAWRRARGNDWDADLTRVGGPAASGAAAQGEHLALMLRLVDSKGRTIDGAEVEIWQCDALATYHHPRVSAEPGRIDPGFQGFGASRSGADGGLAFRTIRPVPYPGRTPHIHVKLRHASFGEVSSQLFVEADPGNPRDFLFRQLDADERAALSMRLAPAAAGDGLRWEARHTLVLPA